MTSPGELNLNLLGTRWSWSENVINLSSETVKFTPGPGWHSKPCQLLSAFSSPLSLNVFFFFLVLLLPTDINVQAPLNAHLQLSISYPATVEGTNIPCAQSRGRSFTLIFPNMIYAIKMHVRDT